MSGPGARIFNLTAMVTSIALFFSPYASAQTLPETAAYVVTGGMVEPKDMKMIGNDAVQLPPYMVGLTGAMPAMVLKVTDWRSCTVRYENLRSDGPRYFEFYLGNIILQETRDRFVDANQLYSIRAVYYSGEDAIYCSFDNGRKTCGRTFDSNVYAHNLPRVHKALEHLYAQYCTSAKRKGAF